MNVSVTVFDDRPCTLGEGALWHPLRRELFWFDITGLRLLARKGEARGEWQFDEMVSAAAWIDEGALLIASESALFRFDLATGTREDIVPLEADDPATRSNDGRADPMGGFWIGTMGKKLERGAGAIYRYHRGELRRLFGGLSVPNAICFSPGGGVAYFSDTPRQRIFRVALDGNGWPRGEPTLFLDLAPEGLRPDGAVTDEAGNLWNAQWGAARVAAYAPDGRFLQAVPFPAAHTSCPAFGGDALDQLFCTSAREMLTRGELAENPAHGLTFMATGLDAKGRPEPAVIL